MDPQLIIAAVTVAGSILRQVEAYSRGDMTPEEVEVFHKNVMQYMQNVQADADTLRG